MLKELKKMDRHKGPLPGLLLDQGQPPKRVNRSVGDRSYTIPQPSNQIEPVNLAGVLSPRTRCRIRPDRCRHGGSDQAAASNLGLSLDVDLGPNAPRQVQFKWRAGGVGLLPLSFWRPGV